MSSPALHHVLNKQSIARKLPIAIDGMAAVGMVAYKMSADAAMETSQALLSGAELRAVVAASAQLEANRARHVGAG
jgi:hypothetical protein